MDTIQFGHCRQSYTTNKRYSLWKNTLKDGKYYKLWINNTFYREILPLIGNLTHCTSCVENKFSTTLLNMFGDLYHKLRLIVVHCTHFTFVREQTQIERGSRLRKFTLHCSHSPIWVVVPSIGLNTLVQSMYTSLWRGALPNRCFQFG